MASGPDAQCADALFGSPAPGYQVSSEGAALTNGAAASGVGPVPPSTATSAAAEQLQAHVSFVARLSVRAFYSLGMRWLVVETE